MHHAPVDLQTRLRTAAPGQVLKPCLGFPRASISFIRLKHRGHCSKPPFFLFQMAAVFTDPGCALRALGHGELGTPDKN